MTCKKSPGKNTSIFNQTKFQVKDFENFPKELLNKISDFYYRPEVRKTNSNSPSAKVWEIFNTELKAMGIHSLFDLEKVILFNLKHLSHRLNPEKFILGNLTLKASHLGLKVPDKEAMLREKLEELNVDLDTYQNDYAILDKFSFYEGPRSFKKLSEFQNSRLYSLLTLFFQYKNLTEGESKYAIFLFENFNNGLSRLFLLAKKLQDFGLKPEDALSLLFHRSRMSPKPESISTQEPEPEWQAELKIYLEEVQAITKSFELTYLLTTDFIPKAVGNANIFRRRYFKAFKLIANSSVSFSDHSIFVRKLSSLNSIGNAIALKNFSYELIPLNKEFDLAQYKYVQALLENTPTKMKSVIATRLSSAPRISYFSAPKELRSAIEAFSPVKGRRVIDFEEQAFSLSKLILQLLPDPVASKHYLLSLLKKSELNEYLKVYRIIQSNFDLFIQLIQLEMDISEYRSMSAKIDAESVYHRSKSEVLNLSYLLVSKDKKITPMVLKFSKDFLSQQAKLKSEKIMEMIQLRQFLQSFSIPVTPELFLEQQLTLSSQLKTNQNSASLESALVQLKDYTRDLGLQETVRYVDQLLEKTPVKTKALLSNRLISETESSKQISMLRNTNDKATRNTIEEESLKKHINKLINVFPIPEAINSMWELFELYQHLKIELKEIGNSETAWNVIYDNFRIAVISNLSGLRNLDQELEQIGLSLDQFYNLREALAGKVTEFLRVERDESEVEVKNLSEFIGAFSDMVKNEDLGTFTDLMLRHASVSIRNDLEVYNTHAKKVEKIRAVQKKKQKVSSDVIFQRIANHLFILTLTNVGTPWSSILHHVHIRDSKLKEKFQDLLFLKAHTEEGQEYIFRKLPPWSHKFFNRLKFSYDDRKGHSAYLPGAFQDKYNFGYLSMLVDKKLIDRDHQPKIKSLKSESRKTLLNQIEDHIIQKEKEQPQALESFEQSFSIGNRQFSLSDKNLYAYFPHLNQEAQAAILRLEMSKDDFQISRRELVHKLKLINSVGSFSKKSLEQLFEIQLREHLIYPFNISEWGTNLNSTERASIESSLKEE